MTDRSGHPQRRAMKRRRRREARPLTGRQTLIIGAVAVTPAALVGWPIGRALFGGPAARVPLIFIAVAIAFLIWGVSYVVIWWRSPRK